MFISLKAILGGSNTFWAELLTGFLQKVFIISIPQITNFYENNPSITSSKLKKIIYDLQLYALKST